MALSVSVPALAQGAMDTAIDPATAPPAAPVSSAALPVVKVNAATVPTLDRETATGSHLGLSAIETPASVEEIDRAQLSTRGDHSIIDAVSRATGISQLAHPGNGGSALGARGFTDSASVTQLFNGVRPYGAIGVTFPFDTWSVDHIDVLRGPASVIYGEGSIGGVVNIVPKLPTRAPIANEMQLGLGTERTARAAFGSGGAIDDRLSYRFDVSGNRSANWVNAGNSRDLSYSAAVRFDPDPRLYFTLTQAQGFQHPMRYFGIPLMNGALDRSLLSRNYNVGDSDIAYRDSWTTLAANWRPVEDLRISSTLYRMQSNRHWRNAEYYAWLPASRRIERTSYTEIFHDQTQYGNVTSATLDSVLFGLRNTASVGFEVNHTRFQHDNNAPYSGRTDVDPYDFASGSFINEAGTLPKYRSQSNQYAVFAEDRLALTSRWSIVGGVRYDHASVNRDALVAGGGFTRTYANTGWRAGTVYALQPDLAVYAQYSVAADPVSSLLMLNSSSANYRLATGKQIEIGAKQTFWQGRADWTLAAYRIVKDNLVTASPSNANESVQVGQQSSRGIEAALGLTILPTLRIDANVAMLRAKFDDYSESTGQGSVSRDGNVPTDVPQRLANLWISWRFQPGWNGSLGMKYVGKRFADAANQLSMGSYTTLDAALAWQVRSDTTLTARVFNMFNRRYIETAYYDQTQWLVGNDRRFEVVLNHRF